MITFSFHPAADEEYGEATQYYNQCRAGLGALFSLEVETAIAQILQAPTRWPIYEGEVRRCLTHKFPYGILYLVEGNVIYIIAIMHCKRKPGYWKNRVP